MARLEQLKARRARSRKRFDFWTAVVTQMQQVRLDCEPTQNSNPRDQTVPAIASGSTTALAFDADDVQGKLAERM